MDANGVAPTPAAYELLFHYQLGSEPGLLQAVDAAIQSGTLANPDVPKELHRRFFIGNAELDEATSWLGQELKQLALVLDASGRGSSAYGQTLHVVGEQLARVEVSSQVRGILDTVASATRLMAETNRALEERVEASSKEIDTLRSKVEVLRTESQVDALTGLANRRAFDTAFAAAVASAQHDDTPLCILMCDIDFFKKFNDTWGHATGDQVLRLVAQCVTTNVKGRDTAARYGGEELVVILPNTTLGDAAKVAEQIRKTVETRRIVKKSTGETFGSITLSIGVSEILPSDTLASLMERADACLYQAKRTGRNRVCAELSAQSAPQVQKTLQA